MSRDKGSFTEQQNKGRNSNNNNTDKENTQNNRMHRATLTTTAPKPTAFPPPRSPLTRTQHEGTWYGIPCSVWPGWVSPPGWVLSWLLVKINPVLAEPRTTSYCYHEDIFRRIFCHYTEINILCKGNRERIIRFFSDNRCRLELYLQ